jgi:hypothetical protein
MFPYFLICTYSHGQKKVDDGFELIDLNERNHEYYDKYPRHDMHIFKAKGSY